MRMFERAINIGVFYELMFAVQVSDFESLDSRFRGNDVAEGFCDTLVREDDVNHLSLYPIQNITLF
jgi:hypothetical protein